MAIESDITSMEQVDEYIKQQLKRNLSVGDRSKAIQKVDIRRNPR